MSRRHAKLDGVLREPSGLLVAAILGLASAVSLLATYRQMVDIPARHREELNGLTDVADLVAFHRCARIFDGRCPSG